MGRPWVHLGLLRHPRGRLVRDVRGEPPADVGGGPGCLPGQRCAGRLPGPVFTSQDLTSTCQERGGRPFPPPPPTRTCPPQSSRRWRPPPQSAPCWGRRRCPGWSSSGTSPAASGTAGPRRVSCGRCGCPRGSHTYAHIYIYAGGHPTPGRGPASQHLFFRPAAPSRPVQPPGVLSSESENFRKIFKRWGQPMSNLVFEDFWGFAPRFGRKFYPAGF